LVTQVIFRGEHISLSSKLRSFSHSRHLNPLRPKYLPRDPIL
jgi:hypothetical protein